MIPLDTPQGPVLQDIRCPSCGRWQVKAYLMGASFLVLTCRCKTKFRVDASELFVITTAASVSRTFDGRRYEGFGLATR